MNNSSLLLFAKFNTAVSSLLTASINLDATRNVLSEVLHRMHGDVPTLACARATNSQVNFMQRDMRQVDATRRRVEAYRRATVCDAQLPRFLSSKASRVPITPRCENDGWP